MRSDPWKKCIHLSQGIMSCNRCKGRGLKGLKEPNFERVRSSIHCILLENSLKAISCPRRLQYFQWTPPHLNAQVRRSLRIDARPKKVLDCDNLLSCVLRRRGVGVPIEVCGVSASRHLFRWLGRKKAWGRGFRCAEGPNEGVL